MRITRRPTSGGGRIAPTPARVGAQLSGLFGSCFEHDIEHKGGFAKLSGVSTIRDIVLSYMSKGLLVLGSSQAGIGRNGNCSHIRKSLHVFTLVIPGY